MLTSDLFNKPVEENCKYGRYYCTTDKKYKCRQGPKQTRASESVEQGQAEGSEKHECPYCLGSGRMVRDPDIGTDQECFVCDGTGYVDDEQGVAEEANPIDTVEMDVPLLIRALEYAREDAKDDMDLHKVVERMLVAAQNGEPLNMDDYNMIFGEKQEVTEKIAYEPDEKGLQHMSLTMPQNAVVIDTPGDLDWYKLGHDIANLQQADPHEYGQSDSDMVIIPASDEEMKKLLVQLDRLGMRYKLIGGTSDQPEIHDEKFEEESKVKESGAIGFVSSMPSQYRSPESQTQKHRVAVTISDPNSSAVSQRGETIQKIIRVSGADQAAAEKRASDYYKRAGYKIHDVNYIGILDEAKRKKKSKSKSSMMSKPSKRRYGGYFYPGYGYHGDGGDSGGGDGGGGESRINEKKDKTKLSTLDLRSELDAHATTLLNIARRKYPMAKSDLAALIKLLDRVQLHSIEKDTAHDKDIKAIRRDVAALEKRVNELYKKQKVKESRLYYSVTGTLNESLRKDFKMRKDRKGWFLPESASAKQKLNAERAFGEPIAEMNLLRPIKMKSPKNPVAVNQNSNKYKNPAKLIKFGK